MNSNASQYSGKEAAYFGLARTEIGPLLPETAERVLEIGCGAGATMGWLRGIRDVKYAAGIELIAEAAREALSNFDDVLVGDVEAKIADLPSLGFDLVLALDVLEHLVDPWKVVGLCADTLRPGGVMIVSIPNIAHYSVAFPLLFRGRWRYRGEGLLDITHLRFFDAHSVIALMMGPGFTVQRVLNVRTLPNFIARIPDRFGGRKIRWYWQKVLNLLPTCHLLDFQYLIAARK